jgi:DNA-binding response OmpR family regulator
VGRPSLLLVSDDAVLGEALTDCLRQAGFDLHCVAGHDEWAAAARKSGAQLVLIDASANRPAAAPAGLPALLLGESGEGAASIARPLRLSLLLQRIRELLQKQAEMVEIGPDCVFLPAEKLLRNTKTGAEEVLTEKEADILRLLHADRPRVISREDLLSRGWGYASDITTHTLETHIYRLRGKMRQVLPDHDWIESRDGGYAFAATQKE